MWPFKPKSTQPSKPSAIDELNRCIDELLWYDKRNHCWHPIDATGNESICCWCGEHGTLARGHDEHGPHQTHVAREEWIIRTDDRCMARLTNKKG